MQFNILPTETHREKFTDTLEQQSYDVKDKKMEIPTAKRTENKNHKKDFNNAKIENKNFKRRLLKATYIYVK